MTKIATEFTPKKSPLFRWCFQPILICLLAASCTSSEEEEDCTDGKCDIDAKITCDSGGSYDDGKCDIDCTVPDIDCFEIYDDWEDASAVYKDFIQPAQGLESSLVPKNDSRVVRLQGLVDSSWEVYSSLYNIGKLPSPTVLLIDDAEHNAFVSATSVDPDRKVAWVVFVHGGLLKAPVTEAMAEAILFHELEHGVRLHSLPGVSDSIRRFYMAEPGESVLGFRQELDPQLQAPGNAWLRYASIVGNFAFEEMGAMPEPSSNMAKLISQLMLDEQSESCTDVEFALDDVAFKLQLDPIFDSLVVPLSPEDKQEIASASENFKTALRMCLQNDSRDIIVAIAEIDGAPEEAIRESFTSTFSESILAEIEGQVIAEQILSLSSNAYSEMRQAESAVAKLTGSDFRNLRYYSDEEQSDDTMVRILKELGKAPRALSDFLLLDFVGTEALDECNRQIAAGEPLYGNLTDSHHSHCWRAYHIQELSKFLND